MRRQALFAALLTLTFPPGAMAADWPVFRGPDWDGSYRGETLLRETSTPGLSVEWQHDLGPAYSGVTVASGRAVTLFSDGTDDVAVAFDAGTGKELWRYRIAATYRGHDGSHDGPKSTPLIAEGRVFVLGPWGHFVALDLVTGEKVWSTHLSEDQGAMSPLHGYGTSPIFADGVVVVEGGAHGGPFATGSAPPGTGPSVLGFDAKSGELLWKVGHDTVNYQSPLLTTIGGRRLVLAPTDVHFFGIDAKSGKVLWQLPHGGRFYAGPGAVAMNPVPLGAGRFFITDWFDSSSVVELAPGEDDQMTLSQVWSGRSIRNTYAVPVYQQGYLYAYSSGFLTCVDAASGKSVWRSRQPGDGFPILVDGHLVILTKNGELHVAEASPEGYREVASLTVFPEDTWTHPSFADGRIYLRSLHSIAAVGLHKLETTTAVEPSAETAGTRFARFLAEAEAAADKSAVVDRFLASAESFPLTEETGDGKEALVHFIYRGEAQDMAIAGDMIGDRAEEAMNRLAGTDLFYYTTRLLADARVSYYFIKDFEERLTDPLNPRKLPDLTGEVSWVGMPRWKAPSHLDEAPEERRGRVEKREIAGHQIDVYVPAGYDDGERRYPVVYVHGGGAAMSLGSWTRTLDNVIGRSVEPLIAVFLHANDPGQEFVFLQRDAYATAFAEEVVPTIDENYRTLATAESRASVGAGMAGYAALYAAFKHPGVVGRVASQSAFLLTMQATWLGEAVQAAGEPSLAVLLEWGSYDSRSEHEAWDFRAENRKLGELLKGRGYKVVEREVHEGSGWAAWRNRTDKVLEWLFPHAP